MSDSELFETDTHWGYFARLRAEDPVHYCARSDFGPYWSVTKYEDVIHVEKHPEIFSSARSIVVGIPIPTFPLGGGFITMDGLGTMTTGRWSSRLPRHATSSFSSRWSEGGSASSSMRFQWARPFDWVDRVSVEVTTGMLATLFNFPWEQRRKLTFWSDMATASPQQTGAAGVTEAERRTALMECLEVFTTLWKERQNAAPTGRLDFVTALANSEATRGLEPMEYLGTLVLLIVGGNDTTRNSISGGVLALNENPDQYAKLREQPDLVPNMVSEIIRWQTPLAHMRRTATDDTELAGKRIAKGDKVVMWYVSANRDEDIFERPNDFLIDRANARDHLAFGRGSTSAWEAASPRCSCASCGRRCSPASTTSRWSASPSGSARTS